MDASEFALHAEVEDDHWWFQGRREILFSLLRRHLPPGRDRLLVEIGCGTGGNLRFFGRHYRVMGIDISPEAAALASARVDGEILLGDFRERLAPRWNEISAVLLPDVLEHVEDDAGFLADIVAAARPGTVIVVTVPGHRFLWSNHDVVLGHLRRYDSDDFRRLWSGQPVDELFSSPFNAILFPVVAAVRMAHAGAPRTASDLRPAPEPLNRLLRALFAAERWWLRLLPLPFGVSYVAILRKRG